MQTRFAVHVNNPIVLFAATSRMNSKLKVNLASFRPLNDKTIEICSILIIKKEPIISWCFVTKKNALFPFYFLSISGFVVNVPFLLICIREYKNSDLKFELMIVYSHIRLNILGNLLFKTNFVYRNVIIKMIII